MASTAGPEHAAASPAACRLCGGTGGRTLFVKRGWTFVRCASCGLVSLAPLPTPADVASHHEASYRDGAYATFAAAGGIRDEIAAHRLALLRPLVGPGPWLDVGCSTGAFVAAATAAGLDAEGLELSAAAVAQARARGLRVHEGAVEAFAPERRYALVTAFDVVEHLPDPAPLIERLATWLADDGLLALTLPDIASLPARLMGRHWFYYAPPDHIHYFTPATARRLLERARLRDVAIFPAFKPLTLAYATAGLTHLSPALGAIARAMAHVLPRALLDRRILLPLGEMLVTARPAPR
jgi:SAM-dependent methyltransferase